MMLSQRCKLMSSQGLKSSCSCRGDVKPNQCMVQSDRVSICTLQEAAGPGGAETSAQQAPQPGSLVEPCQLQESRHDSLGTSPNEEQGPDGAVWQRRAQEAEAAVLAVAKQNQSLKAKLVAKTGKLATESAHHLLAKVGHSNTFCSAARS